MSTPAGTNVRLWKNDGVSKTVDPAVYQSMIGSLLYAAVRTRPDISHTVGIVSKFNSKPSEAHLTTVEQINYYLYKRKLGRHPEVQEVWTCTADWIH